jgi:transcriptional regulator with XRE-family HTH domain
MTRGLYAMNHNTDATVGMNVRRARRYRGMSLEQLAGRIGRSKGWLSMVENGKLMLDKRQDIAAIALALEVSADTLLGQPAPEVTPHGQRWNVTPFRAVLLDATLDAPPDMAARPLPELTGMAAAADQALRGADYAVLHRDLPGLLGELQVHAAQEDGDVRDRALRLLVASTATAAIMLKQREQVQGAHVDAGPGRQAGAAVRG